MKIYALINPGKEHKPCIQAFSTLKLALSAKDLYALHGSEVEEIPLIASEGSLRDWTNFQWPIHLYFVLDPLDRSRPMAAFTESSAYQDNIRPHYPDHPWVDGTLDGLRRSVEKGLRMYRVHMRENGEFGIVEEALAFNAVTTCSARLYSLDPELRKAQATSGYNMEDGQYFIHVYALDENDARKRARPSLELKLKQDREAVRKW